MITNSDQLRIIAFLKRLGCNRTESLTYIGALMSGATSVQELSRLLKKNRVSVHYSVHLLLEKGLLFEIRKGKKRVIIAESPDVLLRLIEKRHIELKSLEIDVEYISKLLNSIPVAKHEVTIVKLYEDIAGFKKMLNESLEAKDEILVLGNTTIFSKLLGEEYYEFYFSKKAELGIHSRIIYSPCAFADFLDAKRNEYKIDLRILPRNQGAEAGFYLWNNTLAIMSLKVGKISCTIIENRDIVHFFRTNIFNHFWEEAKPTDDV